MSATSDPLLHDESTNERNRILLPALVDEIAKNDPSTVFCEIPVSNTTYLQGFRTITYGQFSTAIDGAAWWLRRELGGSQTWETLTYIGPNDLRYPILILGAVKAGYKTLLTSPRNSVSAHDNLMKLLGCTVLITPTPAAPPVTAIMASCNVQLLEFPSLEYFLDETYPKYPYVKVYETAKDEPLVVLHTSGSTGLPKPLVLPHAFGTAFANTTQAEPPSGYISQSRHLHGRRIVTTLPWFHAVGIYFGLISAVYNHTVVVWPLSGAIPSASGLAEALNFTTADSMLLAPSIVEDISKDRVILDKITSSVNAVGYTGGDLSQKSGDLVASKVTVFPIYGSTEMAHGPQIFPSSGQHYTDWKCIGYPENIWGAEFRHYNENLYELRLRQTPISLLYQPAFTLFPKETDFSTRDLFSPHPTTQGLWIYKGRSDDIIVFLNGEKTNPLSAEGHIASHPEVRSAMVLGEHRLEAALLIEPSLERSMSVRDRAELLERVWPTIEAANAECPAYAKTSKSHVMFTLPAKPMVRAGKGTVMRRATRDLYAEETARLYSDANELAGEAKLSSFERDALIGHAESLQEYISKAVRDVTEWQSVKQIDDFFSLGMDSLQALRLARKMQQICSLSLSTIYTNPTVALLTQVIAALVSNDQVSRTSDTRAQHELMSSLLVLHQKKMDTIRAVTPIMNNGTASEGNQKCVVLLTGSTGALGSYTLHSLLENPAITHIYCLNRSRNSDTLQSARNIARRLPTVFPTSRVTFLTGDLAAGETLGLEKETLTGLRSKITHIIHNAWTVDFNLTLSSFSPHLASVVNLVEMAATSALQPHITFLSSISSVQQWPSTEPVLETIMNELDVPAPNGYGRSKYLAERLLAHASEKLNLHVNIVRIGQVAGPRRGAGAWSQKEWFPSLVTTSWNLNAAPETLGRVEIAFKNIDWMPIDEVADILVELALEAKRSNYPESTLHVRHLVNPHPTPWTKVLSSTLSALQNLEVTKQADSKIGTVPYTDWLDLLRKELVSARNDEDMDGLVAKFPAIKLMDFFESLASERIYPVLETRETERASERMRAVEAIGEVDVGRWVAGWFET